MVLIFGGGAQGLKPNHDDFNFYARQCHHIQGAHAKEVGYSKLPYSFKLSNIKYIVVKTDCLNNVRINKRLTHHNHINSCYNPGDVD
jgi:hypothetical protein